MKPQKSIRYQSAAKIFGWPLLCVANGPDPETGQGAGVAKGIIAVGDIAIGVLAIGGVATGGIAIGGVAAGILGLGGVTLGGLVLAGVGVGYACFGGLAIGHYCKGGVTIGTYVVNANHRDPEAVRFFDAMSFNKHAGDADNAKPK